MKKIPNEPYVRANRGQRMCHDELMSWYKLRYAGRRSLAAYTYAILESLPDAQPEDCEQIEEVMRDRWSTLDNLTFNEFKKEARRAWSTVKDLRRDGTYAAPVYPGEVG